MIDENMVERVARILEPKAWAAVEAGRDSLACRNRRMSSLRKAQAVIEAMTIPIVDMKDLG